MPPCPSLPQRIGSRCVAFAVLIQYNTGVVSLAEIKSAVDALSREELAELAAFIRERDHASWDRQIDEDFAENGRRGGSR